MKKLKKTLMIVLAIIGICIFNFFLPFSSYVEVRSKTFNQPKSAQENIVWERVWDGLDRDLGKSVWGDGTFIYTCGTTKISGNDDILLIKWSSNGNQVWNRTWGGSSTELGSGIWGDGTYIYTCGNTYSFGAGSSDFLLIKWDTNGNLIWSKTWGGTDADISLAIWGDGTYIYTCGYTNSYGAGDSDLVLLEWDSSGTKRWHKIWGGPGTEYGTAIWGDGTNLYVGGYTNSYGAGDYDFVIVKWDNLDYKLWNHTWGGSGDDRLYDIWSNGLYLYTTGWSDSIGMGGDDLTLVKWGMNGNPIWQKTWGGGLQDWGLGIWGTGNYIYTCGMTRSYAASDISAVLVKWDNHGNQVWNNTWGEVYANVLYSIWGYGNYLFTCGKTAIDSSASNEDLLLLKWISDERLEISLNSPTENLIYGSGTQINIDIDIDLIILDTVLYKWDGTPDIIWSAPYTTNLPSGDGSHTLYVSATTTTPYISDSESFIFITDDTDPVVVIQSPLTNEVWKDAPAFDLEITEPHIDEIWYTLNNGPNHYIHSDTGEIDQSAWSSLPDGDIVIKFHVSDTLGHLDDDQVVVQKDTKGEQREIIEIVRNTIITASVTGVIGIAFFLIKRKLGKKKKKAKSS